MILRPSVWGPFFWMTIHIIALGYSADPTYTEKRAAKEFFEGLSHLLPCPTCREHYKQHIRSSPITPYLDRRQDLFKWTIDLHNAVNKSLGKPTWTEAELLAYIERLGKYGRSPIITHIDFKERDMKSLATGFGMGVAITGAVAGALYYMSNK
jgi:hypothetical protein